MELTQELVESFQPELKQILREKICSLLKDWRPPQKTLDQVKKDKSRIKELQTLIAMFQRESDPWYWLQANSIEFGFNSLKARCEILRIKNEIEKMEVELKKLLWKYRTPSKNEIDIQRIKESVGPEELLGKALYKTSTTMKFKCIFHEEKTASAVWYKKNKRGYCFGCGQRFDIVDIFMKLNNCTFVEACKKLS